MDENSEAKSIVWTTVQNPAGFVISITSRDGGQVEESYLNIATFLADHAHLTPFVQYRNNYVSAEQAELQASTEREAKEKGLVGVAQELGGVVMDLGLVPFPPGAKDRVAGQKFELLVNEYTNDTKKIQFYREGNEHPLHTHYLNDIGIKTMVEKFAPDWDTYFPMAVDREKIYRGDLIIQLLTSNTKNKQDNFYVNLVSTRRP